MLGDSLRWASAVEQAQLLRTRVVSPAELHEVSVRAIEQFNPLLNAVVAPLFDRPATGVPMILKDAGQEIAGTPHWVGVAALRDAGAVSVDTTDLVRRFGTAGFSIVGKGACPALSNGITTEPAGFEPTRNPWDPSRSVGGSSGGPAAAVAAGMVAVAHGSDATGSLRYPAALCGVATLNPTAARIPSTPPAGQPANPVWRDFVLSRHAEDLGFVFTALTGSSLPDATGPLRVGLLDHDPELGLVVHDACRQAVTLTGVILQQLGHQVEESWPAQLERLWAQAFAAFGIVSDAVRPAVAHWLDSRLGRPIHRGELDDGFFDAIERAQSHKPDEVAAAADQIDTAMTPILEWWSDHDLLVTPTTFQPAWPLGTTPGPEAGTLLAPFSFTGQPALSLPFHHTDDGLPVGVQIVGRPGADELLLRVAQDLQDACNWTTRRPAVVR